MLSRRLIVCLDVRNGRVVKGVQFESLRDVGDPVALASHYEDEGADEIVFLDISASSEDRATLLDLARRTAERLFIPLTIGGGIRSADDVARALRSGADKVSINSAAVAHPHLVSECAMRFGAQCVVASIDAKRSDQTAITGRASGSAEHPPDPASGQSRWQVFTHGGRNATGLDAVQWARDCVARGAGEILVTSIDRDGSRAGYDLELTRRIGEAVDVPVVASGGAGTAMHVVAALREGGADAALVAGILHDAVTTVQQLKEAMVSAGLPTRMVHASPHVR